MTESPHFVPEWYPDQPDQYRFEEPGNQDQIVESPHPDHCAHQGYHNQSGSEEYPIQLTPGESPIHVVEHGLLSKYANEHPDHLNQHGDVNQRNTQWDPSQLAQLDQIAESGNPDCFVQHEDVSQLAVQGDPSQIAHGTDLNRHAPQGQPVQSFDHPPQHGHDHQLSQEMEHNQLTNQTYTSQQDQFGNLDHLAQHDHGVRYTQDGETFSPCDQYGHSSHQPGQVASFHECLVQPVYQDENQKVQLAEHGHQLTQDGDYSHLGAQDHSGQLIELDQFSLEEFFAGLGDPKQQDLSGGNLDHLVRSEYNQLGHTDQLAEENIPISQLDQLPQDGHPNQFVSEWYPNMYPPSPELSPVHTRELFNKNRHLWQEKQQLEKTLKKLAKEKESLVFHEKVVQATYDKEQEKKKKYVEMKMYLDSQLRIYETPRYAPYSNPTASSGYSEEPTSSSTSTSNISDLRRAKSYEEVMAEWQNWEARHQTIDGVDLTQFLFDPNGSKVIPQLVRMPVSNFNLFRMDYTKSTSKPRMKTKEAWTLLTSTGEGVTWTFKCDQVVKWQHWQIAQGWIERGTVEELRKFKAN